MKQKTIAKSFGNTYLSGNTHNSENTSNKNTTLI